MWVVPVQAAEQRLTSPLKAIPISVRTEWGTSVGDASGGVQPGSGPTGPGEGTVYWFCCLSISPLRPERQ